MCKRRWESAAVWVVAVVVVSVASSFAARRTAASEQSEGVYRSYVVRHVEVDLVRSHLEQLLSDTDRTAEVVVDSKRRAVLVSGDEQTHRMAQQLIEAVDRPETGPAAQAKSQRGRIQMYDFRGTDLQRFVADLRTRLRWSQ